MPPESSDKPTFRPEDFAPRPGFKIGLAALLVYLAGIAVHFFVLGGKALILGGGPLAGIAAGGYVGVFLLAILVSFLGFAVVPSRIAATIVFCLSIPALIYGDMKVNALAAAKIHPEAARQVPAPGANPGAPGASPSAVIPGSPTYNATTRGKYIDQAGTAFLALREVKKKAYIDANAAYAAAASAGVGSLASKQAIADRRKVVADTVQANLDYMDFVKNQEDIYRKELEKTPLVPNDVNNTISTFLEKNPFIADAVAAREAQRDALKNYDDMMAMLDASFGRWRVAGGKLAFQKPQDSEEYGRLQGLYKAAADLQTSTLLKLNNEQTAFAAGGAPPAAATTTPPAAAIPASTAAPSIAPPAASGPSSTVAPAASATP